MILGTILLSATTIIKTWWKMAVGIVLGAVMCWPVASCSGRHIEARRADLELQKANNLALLLKARADELTANQRLTDAIAVNKQEQELRNAISSIPDSVPDANRIALGCQRLRQAGKDTADLPACR